MQAPVVFIIPSAVHVSDLPLSYSSVRSVYSAEERAAQTKTGILSIRQRVPGAKIVIVDVGLREDLSRGLGKLADRYIYGGRNTAIRRIADGVNKGHGEAVALILADSAVRSFRAKYVFKLSGRYMLNETFRISPWLGISDALVAKKYDESCISTRLYGFSSDFYETWMRGMLQAIPDLRFGWSMERTIPKHIKAIRHLQPVGVSGLIAPHGVGAVE